MTDTLAPEIPMPAAAAAKPSPFRSPATKVGMILALVCLLQIPFLMVSSLIGEREDRQEDVLAGFRHGWGPEQTVAGPMLVVPYTWPAVPLADGGGAPPGLKSGWIRIPSSRLKIVATVHPETRRRGLFQATIYTAAVEMNGAIAIPALDLKSAPGAAVDWANARLVMGASDLRGLPADTRLEWNGGSAGIDDVQARNGCSIASVSFPAGLSPAPASGASIPFKTVLTLRGTQALRVLPFGRQIDMEIASSWPTPSFTGAGLPLRYEVTAAGFDAAWQMAGDAATAAWQLRDRPLPDCAIAQDAGSFNTEAAVGVELQDAVPTYLMVSRASKYGVLFLVLSYLTLFLFEMLSGVRIHLVQYGLLGLSLSLFALLLISIAEPLGFGAGYAISMAAVLAQASLYTLAVVKRAFLALVFAGVLGALFAFLYVVLSLDAYALLAGTVALFAILSVVMLTTRRINWAGASRWEEA